MGRLTGQRITIVGINYAPEATGIAPYTTALARSLSAEGAHVHVVTGLPHYPAWSVTDPAYEVGSYFREFDGDITLTRCRHWVPSQPDLVGRTRMESSFLLRALRVVRRERSDLVLAVTPSLAGLAAGVMGRRGRPVGVVVQDLTGNAACETGAAKAWVGSVIRAAENALLRRCDKIGVISTGFRREVIAAGAAETAVVDLPNFTHIKPESLPTSAARARLGWDAGRFTVVHTGNMGAKQGLLSVVAAAALAQEQNLNIDFVLMGDGNQRESVAAAAAGLSTVRVLPPTSAADYPTVLAAADLLLVNETPGVCNMSLPSKLTSYAAAGKPILAAVENGSLTAEFLREVHMGHLVPAGQPVELLEAVRLLQEDAVLRESLAATSTRVFHSHYDRAGAHLRYVDFAAELTGARQQQAAAIRPADGLSVVPTQRLSSDDALEKVS